MKAYVAVNVAGAFALDSRGKVILSKLFPKDPEAIAGKLERSRNGEVLEEEKELLKELKAKGYGDVAWDKKIKDGEVRAKYEPGNRGKETVEKEFRRLALETGWVSGQPELNRLLSRVNIILSKRKMKGTVKKDRIAMKIAGVIDDMDGSINSLTERLREWYGLHFPEMLREIKDHEKFIELVAGGGSREKTKGKGLKKLARDSSGMDFDAEDLKAVRDFSRSLAETRKTRERLSRYLERLCGDVIPNTSAVAGPLLASRLLAVAGGLARMARMPSSTIQVLGAEKALFRHMKGQGRAPKYGLLFGHPLIQKAPKNLKGKVARLVSSKLSLAAKMDFFSRKDEGKRIREEMEKKVKAIASSS